MKCVFCGKESNDYGNSTWPIYMGKDAESHRCCDVCNADYVIPCRLTRRLIISVRRKFNIEYMGENILYDSPNYVGD